MIVEQLQQEWIVLKTNKGKKDEILEKMLPLQEALNDLSVEYEELNRFTGLLENRIKNLENLLKTLTEQ